MVSAARAIVVSVCFHPFVCISPLFDLCYMMAWACN